MLDGLSDGDGVVHEWYAEGLDAGTLFLGASMTKSVLAHLVGRAVREGGLALTDALTAHVPELAGTGYDGTAVLDVVTMTSGVDWVEDHRDPDSLASRLLGCFATGADSRALLRNVRPEVPPGTRFGYCTADSQVLDWVRERATGLSYADDVARLWRALGCASDAYVAVDGSGVALAGGGLAATARDWARVAAAGGGRVQRERRATARRRWVEAAARPAYPFLAVGRLPSNITDARRLRLPLVADRRRGRRVTADGSRGQLAVPTGGPAPSWSRPRSGRTTTSSADRQASATSVYLGLHACWSSVGTHPLPRRRSDASS